MFVFCRLHSCFGFLLLCTLASAEAPAQVFDYRKEAWGAAGVGSSVDDETNLGTGPVVGTGFGLRLSRRWGIALELSRNGQDRNESTFEIFGRALLLGGAFHYHVHPDSSAQPYLRLGVTYGNYRGTSIRKPFVPPPPFPSIPGSERTASQNFIGPDLGFGVKIFVRRNISIRPEYRLISLGKRNYDPFVDIVEPPLRSMWFSMGIGYHW